jgi:hypothetical protein
MKPKCLAIRVGNINKSTNLLPYWFRSSRDVIITRPELVEYLKPFFPDCDVICNKYIDWGEINDDDNDE